MHSRTHMIMLRYSETGTGSTAGIRDVQSCGVLAPNFILRETVERDSKVILNL